MRKFPMAWLGTILVPIICVATYMLFLRLPEPWTGVGDYAAFYLSLALGIGCICLLPLQMGARVLIALMYLPIAYWLVSAEMMFFAITVYKSAP